MSEHRIGSDIGWTIFGLGMLVLLAGGLLAAAALLRASGAGRLAVFAATLGIGVLAGNLFGAGDSVPQCPRAGPLRRRLAVVRPAPARSRSQYRLNRELDPGVPPGLRAGGTNRAEGRHISAT